MTNRLSVMTSNFLDRSRDLAISTVNIPKLYYISKWFCHFPDQQTDDKDISQSPATVTIRFRTNYHFIDWLKNVFLFPAFSMPSIARPSRV
jgi:hypothetical protein